MTIYVTKPYLPPLEDLLPDLEKIWQSRILSNSGPFHDKLEAELADFLGVKHAILFNNCTTALMSLLKALNISGEVLTTPFTFVATVSSLLWHNAIPVFCDIKKNTFNICADEVERHITAASQAILAVHCFGNPCETERLEQIAADNDLILLYDAAHAFNKKKYINRLFNSGTASVLSFHATKPFNTMEGGAVVTDCSLLAERLKKTRNFGFVSEEEVEIIGLNGKLNEFSAALGLQQLKRFDEILEKRKAISDFYSEQLSMVKKIRLPTIHKETAYNYSYYPLIFIDDRGLATSVYDALQVMGICCRRYFRPLVSEFSVMKKYASKKKNPYPNAAALAENTLCLPIYPDLELSVCRAIISKIKEIVL